MVDALPSAGGRGGSSSERRPPDLDARLNSCRGQLEDWVTCPSAKTPEGKAKIKEITTRFEAIKQQIKTADEAGQKRVRERSPIAAEPSASPGAAQEGRIGHGIAGSYGLSAEAAPLALDPTLGSSLNLYA